jgi:hypothetical protein
MEAGKVNLKKQSVNCASQNVISISDKFEKRPDKLWSNLVSQTFRFRTCPLWKKRTFH